MNPQEHHVFTWIAGFGCTLMPLAGPFGFEPVSGDGRALRVWRQSGDTRAEVQVVALADGEMSLVAMEGGGSDVVDLLRDAAYDMWPRPDWDRWRVQNRCFWCDLPAGFGLRSLPGVDPPVFEFYGPNGSTLWMQGPLPKDAFRPDQNIPPGYSLQDGWDVAGNPVTELAYKHQGEPWRIMHCAIDRGPSASIRSFVTRIKAALGMSAPAYLLIVSAQGPESAAEALRRALAEVAGSLVPAPPVG